MLKKIIKFNAGDLGVIAALGFGLFLTLQLIINIVMFAGKPDTVPTLCSILVPILLGITLLLFFISNLVVNFDFLLRCSITRIRALGSLICLLILEAAEAVVISLLLAQADRLIAQAWVHARPALTIEEFSLPLWGLILGYGAVLLLGLISGAVLLYFGRKAMAVLWFGWMAFLLLMNAGGWEEVFHHTTSAALGPGAITGIFIAALAVLAAVGWAVWAMLHACVGS